MQDTRMSLRRLTWDKLASCGDDLSSLGQVGPGYDGILEIAMEALVGLSLNVASLSIPGVVIGQPYQSLRNLTSPSLYGPGSQRTIAESQRHLEKHRLSIESARCACGCT